MSFSSPGPSLRRGPSLRFAVGLMLLAVGFSAACMLVVQRLGYFELYGCGSESDCAVLARSHWANPLGWPVLFLGTAYFAAVVAFLLWAGWRAGISPWFTWGVRLGALGSALLVGVMFVKGNVCPYCMVIHGSNLGFWIVVERGPRDWAAPFIRPALLGAVVFVAMSAALGHWQSRILQKAANRPKPDDSIHSAVDLVPSGDPPMGVPSGNGRAATAKPWR